jgi:ribosomal protein L7/L12
MCPTGQSPDSIKQQKGSGPMVYLDQELFQLRQRVAKLERQVAFLMERLNIEYHEEPNQGVSTEVLDLVQRGRTIQAIKRFREETGASLRDAKEFIESLGQ